MKVPDWIGRAWRGEERIRRVFWLYDIAVFCFLIVLVAVVFSISDEEIEATATAYLFYTPYRVWLLLSEWRCAFNCNWRGWMNKRKMVGKRPLIQTIILYLGVFIITLALAYFLHTVILD